MGIEEIIRAFMNMHAPVLSLGILRRVMDIEI